jgi:hypothetical protein
MEGVFFPERRQCSVWACLLVVSSEEIPGAYHIRLVPWPLVVSGLLHIGPGFLVVLLAFVLLPLALLAYQMGLDSQLLVLVMGMLLQSLFAFLAPFGLFLGFCEEWALLVFHRVVLLKEMFLESLFVSAIPVGLFLVEVLPQFSVLIVGCILVLGRSCICLG